MIETMVNALASLGGLLFILGVYFLVYPDRFVIAASYLWRLFAFIFRSAILKAIEYRTKGQFNIVIAQLKKLGLEFQHEPKLRLIALGPELDAAFRGNELVLVLKDTGKESENLAKFTHEYFRREYFPLVRRYMQDTTSEAVYIYGGYSALTLAKYNNAGRCYYDIHISSKMNSRPFKDALHVLENIDRGGYFVHALQRELQEIEKQLEQGHPRRHTSESITQLCEFFSRLANRLLAEDVPLICDSGYASCAVMIIGKSDKLREQGLDPYLNSLRHTVQRERDTIYIVGPEKNASSIYYLAAECKQYGYQVRSYHTRNWEYPSIMVVASRNR